MCSQIESQIAVIAKAFAPIKQWIQGAKAQKHGAVYWRNSVVRKRSVCTKWIQDQPAIKFMHKQYLQFAESGKDTTLNDRQPVRDLSWQYNEMKLGSDQV